MNDGFDQRHFPPTWTAHGQNDLTSRHPEVDCITGQ